MDAIVLAGGAGSRLGGVDKAGVVVGGTSLIERALAAVAGANDIVVVGPRRPTSRAIIWTMEEPRRAGPVAAIAAGLAAVHDETVALLAVDMPLVERGDVDELSDAAAPPRSSRRSRRKPKAHDGAVYLDAAGRDQPLAGVYRTEALRAALKELGNPAGARVSDLVSPLDLVRVTNPDVTRDCDTASDLDAIERALERR